MSPRLKSPRKVIDPPAIKGFRPVGDPLAGKSAESVVIMLEEYEALRLCDYEGLSQLQASQQMGISRPTATRIYASALRKIARAFVEGRSIAIQGGTVYFDSDWYHCASCCCYFNNPEKDKLLEGCPLCGSSNVERFEAEQVVKMGGH